MRLSVFVMLIIFYLGDSYLHICTIRLKKTSYLLSSSSSNEEKEKNISLNEKSKKISENILDGKVDKGLTHIKYNKFAPSAEEAVHMSDEQFRAAIYMRMKADERERRARGQIGNAVSDDYLDSLSRPKQSIAEEEEKNGRKEEKKEEKKE